MYGKTTSDKQKKAVKEALLGKKRSQDVKDKIAKANSKPIIQLSLEGEFIKEWSSTMEVERNLDGFKGNGVTRCCRKQRKTYKNFKWTYKKDYYDS